MLSRRFLLRFSILFAWFILGLNSSVVWSQCSTYYVNSNNANPGDGCSDANAWATLDQITSVNVQAGAQVLLKRGSVWSGETLRVPADGVTIGAYGDVTDPATVLSGLYDVSQAPFVWGEVTALSAQLSSDLNQAVKVWSVSVPGNATWYSGYVS